MLVAKPISCTELLSIDFENYVNYAGSKTSLSFEMHLFLFENYVNYAGSKT